MATLVEKSQLLELMGSPNELGVALGSMIQGGYHVHAGSIGGHSALAMYSPALRTAIVLYNNDGIRFPSMRFELADSVKSLLAGQ